MWQVLFLALTVLIAIVTATMFAIGQAHERRTEQQLAAAIANRIQLQVEGELAKLLEPVERQLLVDLDRIRLGGLRRYRTVEIKDELLPSVRRLRGVDSMMVGDEHGYQLLLMRWCREVARSPLLDGVPDLPPVKAGVTQYFTRDFRLREWGVRSEWTLWDELGAEVAATWQVDLPGYDPRKRPWQQLAMERLRRVEQGEAGGGLSPIVWTEPYELFTTKRPGVSVTGAARAPDGGVTIVAYDLVFDDLCRLVAGLAPTPRSRTILCTDAGSVLARSDAIGGEDPPGGPLEPVATADGDVERAWTAQWHQRRGAVREAIPFTALGQNWWGSWAVLELGGHAPLWLGTVVSGADLTARLGSQRGTYLVAVVFAFAAALLLATLFAWWIARPLRHVVELSRRIGALQLAETPAPRSRIAELQQLIRSLVATRGALREHIAAREAAAQALAEGEARLQRAHRLEAVGRLAGGVAHDFNNLLTGMIGNLALLRRQLGQSHTSVGELDAIEHAIDSAAKLVRQLLTFARRDRPEPEVIDVGERIRHAETLLRRLLREEVDFRLVIAPGPHPVAIDPTQLEQVVVNLVANARDAIAGAGSVRIEVSGGDGDTVRVAVVDDGVGMSEDVQAHAFDPFFTTKLPGEGNGLGLATSYAIVEQAGGSIGIVSEPGRGTTVWLRLPRHQGPVPPQDPASAAPASAVAEDGEVVLCVEDDGMIRRIVERTLTAHGYRVLMAADGVAGLERARRAERIDLLLTDVVMPGMNGGELAARLLELRPELRVLFVSGYALDVLVDRIPAGARLLAKPYTPDELLRSVREVLDASPTSRPS